MTILLMNVNDAVMGLLVTTTGYVPFLMPDEANEAVDSEIA
jgi:hypothetical protein